MRNALELVQTIGMLRQIALVLFPETGSVTPAKPQAFVIPKVEPLCVDELDEGPHRDSVDDGARAGN
jgi:hypothetical protein